MSTCLWSSFVTYRITFTGIYIEIDKRNRIQPGTKLRARSCCNNGWNIHSCSISLEQFCLALKHLNTAWHGFTGRDNKGCRITFDVSGTMLLLYTIVEAFPRTISCSVSDVDRGTKVQVIKSHAQCKSTLETDQSVTSNILAVTTFKLFAGLISRIVQSWYKSLSTVERIVLNALLVFIYISKREQRRGVYYYEKVPI